MRIAILSWLIFLWASHAAGQTTTVNCRELNDQPVADLRAILHATANVDVIDPAMPFGDPLLQAQVCETLTGSQPQGEFNIGLSLDLPISTVNLHFEETVPDEPGFDFVGRGYESGVNLTLRGGIENDKRFWESEFKLGVNGPPAGNYTTESRIGAPIRVTNPTAAPIEPRFNV